MVHSSCSNFTSVGFKKKKIKPKKIYKLNRANRLVDTICDGPFREEEKGIQTAVPNEDSLSTGKATEPATMHLCAERMTLLMHTPTVGKALGLQSHSGEFKPCRFPMGVTFFGVSFSSQPTAKHCRTPGKSADKT